VAHVKPYRPRNPSMLAWFSRLVTTTLTRGSSPRT
jgi:hypothetical protein